MSGHQVTRGAQAIKGALVRQRSQHRYWSSPVSNFEALSILDATEQLARSLPKLTYAHTSHVLFVAHSRSGLNRPDLSAVHGLETPGVAL